MATKGNRRGPVSEATKAKISATKRERWGERLQTAVNGAEDAAELDEDATLPAPVDDGPDPEVVRPLARSRDDLFSTSSLWRRTPRHLLGRR